MPGLERDNPYGYSGYPRPVSRDGNDVSKVSSQPDQYNGMVECGHIEYINSKTGQPTEPLDHQGDDD